MSVSVKRSSCCRSDNSNIECRMTMNAERRGGGGEDLDLNLTANDEGRLRSAEAGERRRTFESEHKII